MNVNTEHKKRYKHAYEEHMFYNKIVFYDINNVLIILCN